MPRKFGYSSKERSLSHIPSNKSLWQKEDPPAIHLLAVLKIGTDCLREKSVVRELTGHPT
jgi:hypothetical protein